MEQLETKLAELEGKKAALFDQGSVDQNEIGRLNAQIKEVQGQINQAKQQAEVEQNHEVRVQESTEKVAYLFDTLKVYGQDLRVFFIDEESYQGVRVAVQGAVVELHEQQSKDFAAIEASYKSQQLADKERSEDMQEKYDSLFEEAAGLKRKLEQMDAIEQENAKLKLDLNDALSKRDAAARESEGLELLVKEKDAHIEQLRIEMATSARGAINTYDQEAIKREKEESERKWMESRIKIFHKRWKPDQLRQTHYLAERADNGETVEFHYYDIGKYLEVSSEEAARFREERAAEEASKPVAPSIESDLALDVVTPPALDEAIADAPFQAEVPDQDATDGLAEYPVVSEGDAEPLTIEDRVEELEKKVNLLLTTVFPRNDDAEPDQEVA